MNKQRKHRDTKRCWLENQKIKYMHSTRNKKKIKRKKKETRSYFFGLSICEFLESLPSFVPFGFLCLFLFLHPISHPCLILLQSPSLFFVKIFQRCLFHSQITFLFFSLLLVVFSSVKVPLLLTCFQLFPSSTLVIFFSSFLPISREKKETTKCVIKKKKRTQTHLASCFRLVAFSGVGGKSIRSIYNKKKNSKR